MNYKDTLNLPQTDFPMKANLPAREPQIQQQWNSAGLYSKIREKHKTSPKYILHDGPPYANGDIHIGHALNKILKDVIVRFKTMQGMDAPYIPGWDCHGLPVEHQLFKQLGIEKKGIDQVEFRKKAYDYAMKYVDIQRKQFQRLGLLGDWKNPYLTLKKKYESAVIKCLNELVKKGYVYKGVKPVNWCMQCETALAEAEVEYSDHSSESIFVLFDLNLQGPYSKKESLYVIDEFKKYSDKVSMLIWTTTPWTLMSNVAIALHPDLKYCLVEVTKNNEKMHIVVAEELLEQAMTTAEIDNFKKRVSFSGKDLEFVECAHPFLERKSVIINADFVSSEEGSGCVHIAPGHGEDDYFAGKKYNLEIVMPVDDTGCFNQKCGEFAGLNVLTGGNKTIIQKLTELNRLFYHNKISHSYPHCWRCKSPIIFRATSQWFVGVDKNKLRDHTLKMIKKVNWIPSSGERRIYSMVQGRPDWCLSRQRYWGVPIPAVYCQDCNEEYLVPEILEKVIEIFAKQGSDAWFSQTVDEFIPQGFKCKSCGSEKFKKEMDILDVWFESGASFQSVLREDENLQFPADMYLEGSDQHRGWFQSSLLIAMGSLDKIPFKSVLTHGFVVDSEGRKMSKSLGNVISPQDIVKKYGADILRLWVASCNYHDDVRISSEVLARCADTYRKIRNTLKYMLGNIYDFSEKDHALEHAQLLEIDRWALSETSQLLEETTDAYEKCEFHRVYRALYNFCIKEMSSFYLDILKDRLYTSRSDSIERRSAQTVLYYIVCVLIKIIAPVLVHTAEEAWQALYKSEAPESIHMMHLPKPDMKFFDESLQERWRKIIEIRDEVLLALEQARVEKVIGGSLESSVLLKVKNRDYYELLKGYELELPFIFIVSNVELTESDEDEIEKDIEVIVSKAEGQKCQRCWNYSKSVGENKDQPEICHRCVEALK